MALFLDISNLSFLLGICDYCVLADLESFFFPGSVHLLSVISIISAASSLSFAGLDGLVNSPLSDIAVNDF